MASPRPAVDLGTAESGDETVSAIMQMASTVLPPAVPAKQWQSARVRQSTKRVAAALYESGASIGQATLHCPACNRVLMGGSGLATHMRSVHPDLYHAIYRTPASGSSLVPAPTDKRCVQPPILPEPPS